jgi:hypothetical protein
MSDDRDLAPIPGSSPLPWLANAVAAALALIGLVVVGLISLGRDDLGPTLTGLVVVLVICGIGAAITFVQRRDYLRAVRNGDVIERRKWDASDIDGPNTYLP